MGYTQAEAKAFIEHIAPIIQKEGFSRGYSVVSTTIAQAIVEGACGKSGLAKNYHNHFGLKCGKNWLKQGLPSVNMKTKEEYTSGTLTSINDYFRVFSDDIQGVAGYYDFISASRYANLRKAKDFKEFAEFLKKDGYATSSTYVDNLCNKVKIYGLTKWDKGIKYFPQYSGSGDSIINALDSLNIDSSYKYRKQIYNANFSGLYAGTASQNTAMMVYLTQGILKMP
ncbi:MAG: glucosaminidase domain-containing protein [Bacteroidaceae bacterium]|nr:glucosaminidase domain-containing protein [Bacteroidaceae bacterium]